MTTQPAVTLTGRAPTSPGDFYVMGATEFPHITQISAAVTGIGSHKLIASFTLATSGVLKNLQSDVTYEPATSGYATPIAVAGKVTLAAGKEYTGGQGAIYGVQGQLHFETGAILNQANAVFAGLRGVITASGTPVFTALDTLAGIYVDNLCATNLAGVGARGASLASFQNHGGTLDDAILLRGNNKITNLLNLITFGGGCIGNGAKAGAGKNFACKIDGVTHYLNFYT